MTSLSGLDGLAPLEHPLAVEHRGQLIYLLREAAELEHGIMCQYLFAAFSLKQGLHEGLTEAQLEAVERWRGAILKIARQEMLHLALVQNLLTAIGAAPHLGRPNFPSPAHYFPPGVILALMPFGEEALRHFLFLERPEGMPIEDAVGYAAAAQARPVALSVAAGDDDDIVAHAQSFATVGHLYRAIDIGFGWLTSKLGPDQLFVGPLASQGTPESFGWPELRPVTDLASAHAAIDVIVEQGEGVRGEWRTAHFGTFLGIFDEFQALRAAEPSFEPARPALAGVVRDGGAGGADLPRIDHPLTARVADLFDVVDEIVVQALTRYFAVSDETPAQRAALGHLAVGLMFSGIKPLGQQLTLLPFGPAHPTHTAGPTFALEPQGTSLLPYRPAAWVLLEERLREAAGFGRQIQAPPELGLDHVCNSLERQADTLHTLQRSTTS